MPSSFSLFSWLTENLAFSRLCIINKKINIKPCGKSTPTPAATAADVGSTPGSGPTLPPSAESAAPTVTSILLPAPVLHLLCTACSLSRFDKTEITHPSAPSTEPVYPPATARRSTETVRAVANRTAGSFCYALHSSPPRMPESASASISGTGTPVTVALILAPPTGCFDAPGSIKTYKLWSNSPPSAEVLSSEKPTPTSSESTGTPTPKPTR